MWTLVLKLGIMLLIECGDDMENVRLDELVCGFELIEDFIGYLENELEKVGNVDE